jgi:hypothetical protein
LSKKRIYLLASVLILISLALIVVGLGSQTAGIWGAGLVVITTAMLLSLSSRWVK